MIVYSGDFCVYSLVVHRNSYQQHHSKT